jgi:ribosome-binding factor A
MSTNRSQFRSVRQAQKESLLYREIAELFRQHAQDEPELQDLYVTRVDLAPDLSTCTVFFFSPKGEPYFKQQLRQLVLYKPSLRRAIAHKVALRRTPDFVFRFDETVEKQQKIDALFDKIKTEPEE